MITSSLSQNILENLSLVKLITGCGTVTILITFESAKHPPIISLKTLT